MSWDQVALVAVGAVAGYGGYLVQAVIGGRREQQERCEAAVRASRDAVDGLRRAYYQAPIGEHDLEEAAPGAQPLVWDLRRDGTLICHPELRRRIEFVTRALGSLHAIETFNGARERTAAWHLTTFAWESLCATMRHEALPAEPVEMRDYAAAIAAYEEAMEENYRRERTPIDQ